MTNYGSYQSKEQVMICVVGPNLSNDAIRLAEETIAKANNVIRIFPTVGDILEPIPGLRLLVRERRFETREKPYIWLHTEVVQ